MTIANIKISELQDIGGNLTYQSILPIDDLNASPITTKKGNLQIIGNYILSQAGGGNFVQAAQATLAQSVVNAAQPNITSLGTLTSLDVSGDLTIAVGNLKIPGGVNGYVLQTDGNGNLSWTAQTGGNGSSTGNLSFVGNAMYNLGGVIVENADLSHGATAALILPINGNITEPVQLTNSYGNVLITAGNNANTINWNFSGDGTLYTPGNLIVEGNSVYIGSGANANGLANAALVISSTSEQYVQSVITNVSDIGSADMVAQGHRGDDMGGYVDVGFNSCAFSDPEYSATGAGDGYLLVDGYAPGQAPLPTGGNLVLGTSDQGLVNDIIFTTGGYTTTNIIARFSNANNAFEMSTGNITVPGAIQSGTGTLTFSPDLAKPDLSWVITDTAFGPDTSVLAAPISDDIHQGAILFPGTAGNGIAAWVGTIGSPFDNSMLISSTSNITISSGSGNLWTFANDSNLSIPGGIIGNGNLELYPDINNLSGKLDIYLTSGPDIHIAGVSENLILGRDDTANVTVSVDGNVYIQSTVGTPHIWNFGSDGNLVLPLNGTVSYYPSTPTDWSGTPPTTVGEAIDRLASVVKSLNGGTGA